MRDPQALREAIAAAKKAIADQKEHGYGSRAVAFDQGAPHVGFTELNFSQLAILVEAAEKVADA